MPRPHCGPTAVTPLQTCLHAHGRSRRSRTADHPRYRQPYGLVLGDRDAPFIVLIEALAWPALLSVPIGLVIMAWAFRIRHPLAWIGLMALGLPLAAVLWLAAVATLGGLTAKPL
jgi:hypothetical protein